MKSDAASKDTLIQIRASAATKATLTRAATLRGQTLSEFVLESSRARAEEIILDQRLFSLEPESYEKFLQILDAPPKPSTAVHHLLRRKPAWQKKSTGSQS